MRTLKLIILSLMVCCVQSAWATEITRGGIHYSLNENNKTATLKFNGSSKDDIYGYLEHYSSYTGDIVVPSSLEYSGDTYTVTAIGDNAFSNSSITSISIPESVTSIGSYCFRGCSLTSISIPKGVTSLGWRCFWGCSSLTSITIPESMTSLGADCFCGCSSLTSINIPEGVTSLGEGCFHGCSSLTSINIPEGVTSIRYYCFRGCSSLTSITIPGSVTSLEQECFAGCSSLTSITIPGSVTSLGESCFAGCSSLTSITIPGSVTSLGESCFRDCSSLTSITIPESVTSLRRECFYGCSNLTSITIPESVTSLGTWCFYGCSSLTSINIPKGVTSLGHECFYGCSSLTSITIPESVTLLGKYCFYGCSSLTSIQVAEGNTVYDSRENCNAVIETATNTMVAGCRSTIIPESVTSLGNGCFYGCSSLTSITIPKGVTSLGESCFRDCSGLASISIPEGVTSLGESCFRDCSSLASISFPESVTSLGEYCFLNCSSLTSITIPKGVTSLGESFFRDCSSLTSIAIPERVSSLGGCCFLGCSSLASISIPESMTSIGDDCFSGCYNLTVVRFYSETPPSMSSSSFYFSNENGYEYKTIKVYVPSYGLKDYENALPMSNRIIYPFIEQIELASDFSMARGAEKKMDYKLLPEGADDDAVDWSSGDSSIASVSANGILTAYKVGKVSINATATDGGNAVVTNSTTIVVRDSILVQSINIPSEISVTRDSTYTFTPTVSPSTADLQTLAWASDNESVATVDSTGIVTAKATGSATITVSATDGSNTKATCKVTVPPTLLDKVTLSTDTLKLLKGTSGELYCQVSPSSADNTNVVWASSNEQVAKCEDGVVTALSAGTANIIATAADGGGAADTCVVVVRDSILVQSINIPSEVCVTRGSTYTFMPTISPSTADQQTLAWASDNESVATVDGNGVVTGVGPGTATITATTTDGSNLSASCVITVVNFGSEWTEVTNSNIGSLTGGSVIKICPYGYGGDENMALSSSTTGDWIYGHILTNTERAGQEGGNEWTLVDAGDGTFYLRNGVGIYWAFQQSDAQNYYMKTVFDQSDAVKMSLVWNTTYSGVAFKNAHDGTYLCNLLDGENYAYNWYNGDEPLTSDTNYTYNVYVFSDKAAGIDGINANEDTGAVYYQLNGVKLAGEPQKEGIYIRVKDGQSRKVVVKRK